MKKIVSLVALLFALPVYAKTKFAAPALQQPVTLTDVELVAVKEAVMGKLKDPDSARFKGIKATGTIFNHKTTGLPVLDAHVCGWVNAKNSYSGYVGMMPFSVIMMGDEVLDTPGAVLANDARGAGLIINHCLEYGIDLTN